MIQYHLFYFVQFQNEYILIRILLFTGLRRGELLGLEWHDINFDTNTIQIRRSSQYLPDRGIYEDGVKNDTSDRVMKISQSAAEDLKTWRALQRKRAFEMGDRWHSSDRLFIRLFTRKYSQTGPLTV